MAPYTSQPSLRCFAKRSTQPRKCRHPDGSVKLHISREPLLAAWNIHGHVRTLTGVLRRPVRPQPSPLKMDDQCHRLNAKKTMIS